MKHLIPVIDPSVTICRLCPSRVAAFLPTIPPGPTNLSEQITANPSAAYDNLDAPISRRTRLSHDIHHDLFDKPAPLQQPTGPNKPTTGRSDEPAPIRSPDLDMESLTSHVIALKGRAASLERENENLKTLNQELKTKYEVLAKKVAALADLLRPEA